jgi:hypothetical protein
MEQKPDPAVRALAFASGLRKNVLANGNRWKQWPRGERNLAGLVAKIDAIAARLRVLPPEHAEADLAACFAELRAILEWATYQSTALATVRTLNAARRTRSLGRRFGILTPDADAYLADSDESLIATVRAQNGYLETLRTRYPTLEFPRPLVAPESLSLPPERPPGRLDLIQRLMKSRRPRKK